MLDQYYGSFQMKTKFAHPEERDLRFVRNCKLRQDDFPEELDLSGVMLDGAIVIGFLMALLYVITLLGM